jgi:hypothetical protein
MQYAIGILVRAGVNWPLLVFDGTEQYSIAFGEYTGQATPERL